MDKKEILRALYWMVVGAAITAFILDYAGLLKKGPDDNERRTTEVRTEDSKDRPTESDASA